jgi:hypothetical protein
MTGEKDRKPPILTIFWDCGRITGNTEVMPRAGQLGLSIYEIASLV